MDSVAPESGWPKLTRVQLIDLATRIMNAGESEPEIDALEEQFEGAVLMPNATALLLWPEHYPPDGVSPDAYAPTPEEVVDRVLAYRPILVGSGEEPGCATNERERVRE